jgi:hypothetical protein
MQAARAFDPMPPAHFGHQVLALLLELVQQLVKGVIVRACGVPAAAAEAVQLSGRAQGFAAAVPSATAASLMAPTPPNLPTPQPSLPCDSPACPSHETSPTVHDVG